MGIHLDESSLDAFVGGEEGTRRWDSGQDDAPNALVQATEERPIDGAGRHIGVKLFVVGRLDASLDGVERVDEEIDAEGSERAGLQ